MPQSPVKADNRALRAGRLGHTARRSSRQIESAIRAPLNVPGPFPARRDTSLEYHPTPQEERGIRAFWWDGFWASSSETILANYLGLFILAFGASNSQVGLLASLSSLFAALAFIPGAKLVEHMGRKKPVVLVTGGGIARVVLLGMAIVPFVAHGTMAIWLVIGIASFRSFWGFFAVPAWTSLTAEVVPIGIRGRVLASRNIGMGLAALATAPVAGFLIDRYTGFQGWELVWVIAFATGAISTWCYSRIPEPEPHPHEAAKIRTANERGLLSDILSDRNFVLYLVSVGVWNIALNAAGPFFNVYLVEDLGASTAMVGFLAALPALTGVVGFAWLGPMMDRRGTRWMMIVNGLLIPLLPLAWLFVTDAWQVVFINGAGGLLWAGYNLALTNMVMLMAPPEKRARYAAAFQTVTFAGLFLGPLLGGVVIDMLGFQAVFVLSAIGRFIGTGILTRVEPEYHEENAARGRSAAATG